MAKMTRMQQKIYDYIAQALREQGYPPSVREIGEAVGLKSPSTVHFHLKHMEELGVLTKGAGKGRALTLAQPMQGEMPDAGTGGGGTGGGPHPRGGQRGCGQPHIGGGVH